jgi:type I restriction enzyme R subunit
LLYSAPRGELEHIRYFCGNIEIPAGLDAGSHRAALYKATVASIRAYANLADELEPAGYSVGDNTRIKQKLDRFLNAYEIIRKVSGEILDLKACEADMRHLIDTYIEAAEPRTIWPYEDMGLLELIVKTGIAKAMATQLGEMKSIKTAIAETIENSVRKKIIKEHLADSAFFEKMPALLNEIIPARKAKAFEYEEYRKRIAELAKKPKEYLEYILVHEMVHLLRPTYNARFVTLMDRYMPAWRHFWEELNLLPVSHEKWDY